MKRKYNNGGGVNLTERKDLFISHCIYIRASMRLSFRDKNWCVIRHRENRKVLLPGYYLLGRGYVCKVHYTEILIPMGEYGGRPTHILCFLPAI